MSDEEKKLPVLADKGLATDAGLTEAKELKTIEEKYADVTLRLVEDYGHTVAPLTPEGVKKLSRKLYLNIMLLLCVINLVLFVS